MNEQKENKKTIPFKIASKKNKIPRRKVNQGDERPMLSKPYITYEGM